MEFLVRLFLTVLLSPIWLIIGFSPSFLWEGYGEERAARKREDAVRRQGEIDRRNLETTKRLKEKQAIAVAERMAAHPVEAARIELEKRRRFIIEEETRSAKLAAEEAERQLKLVAEEEARRAKLIAEEEERRKAQQALEAALAIPLSSEKAKLLSEMPFPPALRTCNALLINVRRPGPSPTFVLPCGLPRERGLTSRNIAWSIEIRAEG